MKEEATLDLTYHEGRQTKRALVYRLARRTAEVLRAIEAYGKASPQRILDVGTADGLMLERLQKVWPQSTFIALDMSHELLLKASETLDPVNANAIHLPFSNNCFDVLVATAVIEHVSNPQQLVHECYRVLAPSGICIVTTPDAFFEKVATAIGHLPAEDHNKTFHLSELQTLFQENGFCLKEAQKFMISPWGFPAELIIERAMKSIGLGFLLLNQLVVAQKPV